MPSKRIAKLNDEFDLKLILYLTKNNAKYLIMFAILMGIGMFVFLRYTTPVYEANTIIQLNSDNKAEKVLDSKKFFDDDLFKKLELMRSASFQKRVIERLPLDVSYYVKGKVLNFELYKRCPFYVDHVVKAPEMYGVEIEVIPSSNGLLIVSYTVPGGDKQIFEVAPGKLISTPQCDLTFNLHDGVDQTTFFTQNAGVSYLLVLNDPDLILSTYSQNIYITILNDVAWTIKINVKDNDAVKAADIANTIAEEFQIFEVEQRMESANSILEFIDTQLVMVYDALSMSEDSLRNIILSGPDSSMDKGYLMNESREVEKRLISLRMEKDALVRLRNKLDENIETDIYSLFSLVAGLESQSYLERNIQALQELVSKREEYLISVTENATQIENIDRQIQMQKRGLRITVVNLITNIDNEIRQLDIQLRRFKGDMAPEATGFSLVRSRAQRIYSINEKFYNQLIERKTEYSIAKAGYVSQLIILDPARPNFSPIFPNKKQMWFGTFIVFFLFSVAFIILKYLFYNNIVSLNDVVRYTNIPVLGVIPKFKQHIPVSQLIVDSRPKSLIAESLRAIRTNLQFVRSGHQSKIISITSTISGEGKTFVAINLAGVMAFSEKNVIILDFDMRKPKIHVGFNTDNEKGISSILLGLATIEECIKQSSIPNLHFITAGPSPLNPSELILSDLMDEMLDKLKESYAYIIIDNPPIGLVSDSMKCLQRADYPVYVVKANYSKRDFIYNIERLHNENNLRYLSIVLNAVDPEITGAGSTKGYAYGYGYGYGYDKSGYYQEGIQKKKGLIAFIRKLIKR